MTYFIFDIETGPDLDRFDFYNIKSPYFKKSLVEYRDGYKWEDGGMTPQEYEDHVMAQMSLVPEYLKIIGLGWQEESGSIHSAYVGESSPGLGKELTEELLLEKFWSLFKKHHCRGIGYNILSFDIPAILVRSLILGVDIPNAYNSYWKPWEMSFADIMKARFTDWRNTMSLKDVFLAYKPIANPPPIYDDIEDVRGDEVYNMWKAGEIGKAKLYLEYDIWRTNWLYQFWQGAFTT